MTIPDAAVGSIIHWLAEPGVAESLCKTLNHILLWIAVQGRLVPLLCEWSLIMKRFGLNHCVNAPHNFTSARIPGSFLATELNLNSPSDDESIQYTDPVRLTEEQ